MSLAREGPAVAGAECESKVDRRTSPLDLPPALGGVGVREVRREAEHRRAQSSALELGTDLADLGLVRAAEKAVVHFDGLDPERGCLPDPVGERHRAVRQIIEIGLGEDRDLRTIHFSSSFALSSWESVRSLTLRNRSSAASVHLGFPSTIA